MQDIRLVGNDGEYLNLETQDGDKFRLVLDETLRSAVKRDSSVQLDSISISPREIQDAVRAGATAEEVSAKYSVPLDYVEKFALTVVDEIGHIIASAQSVRIAIAADRYSHATQLEFGEVVSDRISIAGGDNISWSACKHEGSPWQVTVSYEISGSPEAAKWAFDQRKLILSPENDVAVKYSAGDHESSVSTPKLRPIEPATENTQVIDLPLVTADQPVVTPPTLHAVSAIEELTKSSLEAVEALADEMTTDSPQPLSATADLLEALRRKRAETAKSSSAIEAPAEKGEAAGPSKVEAQPSAVPAADSPVAPVEELEPTPITPSTKKGRPSMPSWDEIVFGTKTED
jgi:hypothetical protein